MAKNRMLYQKKTLTYRLGHGQKSNGILSFLLCHQESRPKIESYIKKKLNLVAKSWPKIDVCVNTYYILVLAEQ